MSSSLARKAKVVIHHDMMKHIPVGLLALLAIASPASAKSNKVQHYVEIDGTRYRVAIYDGDMVLVANKSAYVSYDIHERDRQRQAVVMTTGCKVVDELPSNDAKLRGKLDCSEKAQTAP